MALSLLSLITLSLFHNFSTLTAGSDIAEQRNLIRSTIFSKYNKQDRPKDSQTVVTVYMKILSINSVSVTQMEYSTDVYLRQEWVEERLAWNNMARFRSYNANIVSPSLKKELWLPDLFFRNGKEGYVHKMTLPNYLMRLSPNGLILYSQKITMRFSCQMDLKTFPMDTQICDMNIGSYGYTLDELQFKWRDNDSITIAHGMQISEFNSPIGFTTKDCSDGSQTSTGSYTCLLATFILKRQLESYIVSTFIPSILIVMVSWLNFWIHVDSVPARVMLGLVTLLGILTQSIGISSTLPRVSYIKAIDIWAIWCIIFVICALLEYAVANSAVARNYSNSMENEVKIIVQRELMNWCTAFDRLQISHMQVHNTLDRDRLQFCHDLENLLIDKAIVSHKKISKVRPPENSIVDVYSRFLFPALFLFYNCFYWLYFLVLVNHSSS